MTAAEMQFELACDGTRAWRIAMWNEHVTKLEDLRCRQIEVFRRAQRQRKILITSVTASLPLTD
ncbi:MAG: hypothetical protein ABSF71_30780 [Terriglobia bacterium]|jgi:hypothetical protein